MKKTDKFDWVITILALVAGIMCIFISPTARLEWVCIVVWIINSMCRQGVINNLESTIDDLHRYIKELEDSNADIWKKYGNTLKEKENEEAE